jgi:hypothetical protein
MRTHGIAFCLVSRGMGAQPHAAEPAAIPFIDGQLWNVMTCEVGR